MTDIIQPKHLKCGITRKEKLPSHIVDKIKNIADVPYENSFCINFEKTGNSETTPILTTTSFGITNENGSISVKQLEGDHPLGGMYSTEYLEKCDIFGHSHPKNSLPNPSLADLKLMKKCKPQFIVGKNKIFFFNIENEERYKEFIDIYSDMKGVIPTAYNPRARKHWTDEEIRKYFLEETGVRAYPYENDMLIEFEVE